MKVLIILAVVLVVAISAKRPRFKLATNTEKDPKMTKNIFQGIWPGTKWCGLSNIANGTELVDGPGRAADFCCRQHDSCPKYVDAFATKYGVFNHLPYNILHCDCDELFLDCLKNNNDQVSNSVGQIFFNFIRVPCFKDNGKLYRSKY
ncbi:phospholipase A2-like [Lineus longissimus]|uniref:phospholipase A2-like n=1 Tax=Lineus longissimus TaxID=88925 RepID=UPI00315CC7C6